MSESPHLTRVRVRRERPPVRTVELLETGETVTIGVPGWQADHYGFPDGELRRHGGTFDYVVGALAACLTGTLGVALSARGIPSDGDRLTAEADGEVEVEDGVLVLRRVTVRYTLRGDPAKRDAAERAHTHHVRACGVARSLMPCIEVRTELELVPA